MQTGFFFFTVNGPPDMENDVFVIDVRSDREICGHIELANLRSLNREREMPVNWLEKGGRRDNAWREK